MEIFFVNSSIIKWFTAIELIISKKHEVTYSRLLINWFVADYQTFCWQLFTQPAITCSKLTIETLEQDVKYVQSLQ